MKKEKRKKERDKNTNVEVVFKLYNLGKTIEDHGNGVSEEHSFLHMNTVFAETTLWVYLGRN